MRGEPDLHYSGRSQGDSHKLQGKFTIIYFFPLYTAREKLITGEVAGRACGVSTLRDF